MSRESGQEMAVAAANPAETPRLQEPPMEFCPVCECCYEADEIQHVLIPGGDGESNPMCWSCWDASGRRPAGGTSPQTPQAAEPETPLVIDLVAELEKYLAANSRECSYCGVTHTNDRALCTRCYVESHI